LSKLLSSNGVLPAAWTNFTGQDFIKAIDENGDGKLSLDEIVDELKKRSIA